MTLEETLAAIVEAKVAPFRQDVRRLTEELTSLRHALPPTLLTVVEAAKALGVSVATVRRRVKDGSLPLRRVGRLIRVDLGGLRPKTDAEVVDLATRARRG